MRYDAVAFLESLFLPGAGQGNADSAPATTSPPDHTPADLPADWHALWDERAAIMEYEGGLSRELAEHLALLEIVKRMHAGQRK
ncbi:MAG TPA: hypothetical protein VKE74_01135 [Gemmataceae bacterium]|nr:hypothetical protein [Gemmataceae bacterium]